MAQKVLPDTRFMSRGSCIGIRDIMFPPNNVTGKRRRQAYVEAARICGGCPVRAECLEWALTLHEPIEGGVVAGLNPSQLSAARRARTAERQANYVPKCGTEAGLVWHTKRGETCSVCADAHNRKNQRYGEVA